MIFCRANNIIQDDQVDFAKYRNTMAFLFHTMIVLTLVVLMLENSKTRPLMWLLIIC